MHIPCRWRRPRYRRCKRIKGNDLRKALVCPGRRREAPAGCGRGKSHRGGGFFPAAGKAGKPRLLYRRCIAAGRLGQHLIDDQAEGAETVAQGGAVQPCMILPRPFALVAGRSAHCDGASHEPTVVGRAHLAGGFGSGTAFGAGGSSRRGAGRTSWGSSSGSLVGCPGPPGPHPDRRAAAVSVLRESIHRRRRGLDRCSRWQTVAAFWFRSRPLSRPAGHAGPIANRDRIRSRGQR